jgi:hypothetical protein
MPCENYCTCFLIYFRKAVLGHRPMSIIEKMGTPARYIAIAAPLLIECVPISYRRIPSFVSPIVSTPSRIRFEIMSEVILMILFPCFTSKTGGFLFVPLQERILRMIEAQSLTGHRDSSKVFHWDTVSHFLPFFCRSKVMETQSSKCNFVKLCGRVVPCRIKMMFQRCSCLFAVIQLLKLWNTHKSALPRSRQLP